MCIRDRGEENTMSVVAKKLGITAGSLTTAVNSLVNKKYVLRKRSEQDRRVVYVSPVSYTHLDVYKRQNMGSPYL